MEGTYKTMKNNKKLTSLLIVFAILFSVFGINGFSQESISIEYESKIFSNATINQDFCPRTVLVVMDKNVGRINKVHDKSFFGDIDFLEIVDLSVIVNEALLTADDYRHIPVEGSRQAEFVERQNRFDTARQTQQDREFQKIVQDVPVHWQIDRENFRQILSIELTIDCKQNVLDVINKLEQIDGVLSAEPSYIEHITVTNPSDPAFRRTGNWLNTVGQWPLYSNIINAPGAWALTTGSRNIRVGVADTGIFNHDDLRANLVAGWNFVHNNNNATDTHGHGTMTAGIIGGVGNNGIGITGVNQRVSLVPLRISIGGSINVHDVIDSINFATDNNIHVFNYSAVGRNPSTARQRAIENYPGLFVASAGNAGDNNDNPSWRFYPASYNLPNIISVGASLQDDRRAVNRIWGSSNFGRSSVHLFAPTETVSTGLNHTYPNYGGTSCAAPHVAGVAALLLSRYSNDANGHANTKQLKWAIMQGVDTVANGGLPSNSNLTNLSITGGRLNAHGAFLAMASLADPTYGIHHIRNAVNASNGSRRYLDSSGTINNGVLTTTTLSLGERVDNEFQRWVVQRVGGSWQVRSAAVLNGTNRVARIINSSNLLGATNVNANTQGNITIQRNTDGTVTFRRGSASNALALGVGADGSSAEWQTFSATNNAQRWHLERHQLSNRIGDTDQNNVIDVHDSLEILRYLTNMNTPVTTAVGFYLANITRTGEVTIQDSLQILMYIVKNRANQITNPIR
jgi:hypothetical protein